MQALNVVAEILEWLSQNSELEFTEDTEKERRIQPILDKENKDRLDFYKKEMPFTREENIHIPRPLNKVYKITKKN